MAWGFVSGIVVIFIKAKFDRADLFGTAVRIAEMPSRQGQERPLETV
jgi:hypothetical protein